MRQMRIDWDRERKARETIYGEKTYKVKRERERERVEGEGEVVKLSL